MAGLKKTARSWGDRKKGQFKKLREGIRPPRNKDEFKKKLRPQNRPGVAGSINLAGTMLKDDLNGIGDEAPMLFEPDIPVPEEETIIPIPDERSAELKARRRRAKSSSSGRDSTILTEGLGG